MLSGGVDLPVDRHFAVAYDYLRRLAGRYMRGERPGHLLQPTELVHEAYLKLGRGDDAALWRSQTHFVACASRAMRQVLVDYARRSKAAKRQAERVDWTITSIEENRALSPDDLLSLDQALNRLAGVGPNGHRQVRLIELVWLGGMDMTAAAQDLGISRRQAHRDWAWARAWLQREMRLG